MNRPRILITRRLPQAWITALEARCNITWGSDDGGWTPELTALLPQVEGLFTTLTERVDAAVLERAPKLRVVSNMAVGVDNIEVEACTARAIPVGHTPDVLTEATADMAFTLLLAAARGLLQAVDDARGGRWGTWSPTRWLGCELFGRTLGIVGFGRIGQAVARRARGFGMRVVVTHPRPVAEGLVDARLELPELLEQSDFVSLHVPLTPLTRGLIGVDAFARMKPTAVLVNTSRGPVVDAQALLDALQTRTIAAAGLDVTDPEPLPAEHPLYRQGNCIIAPHIGSATTQTRQAMAVRAAQNLLAALDGQRVPHCVNPVVYDG